MFSTVTHVPGPLTLTVQYSTVTDPSARSSSKVSTSPECLPPTTVSTGGCKYCVTCHVSTNHSSVRGTCPPITAHLADDAEAGSVPRGVEPRRLLPRVLGHAVHEHRVLAAAARHPEPDQSEASVVSLCPPITAHLSWAGSCTQPAAALGPGMLAALCHAPSWPRCRLYTSALATPPCRPPTM